jgi:hypothetical protein
VRYQQELLYWGTMPQEMKADPAVREMERQSVERLRKSLLAPYVEVSMALALPVSRDNVEARIRFMDRPLHFWPTADIVQKQIALLAMAGRDDEALELIGSLARLQPSYLSELNGKLEGISTDDIPVNSPVRRRVRELAERLTQGQPS